MTHFQQFTTAIAARADAATTTKKALAQARTDISVLLAIIDRQREALEKGLDTLTHLRRDEDTKRALADCDQLAKNAL